MEDLPPVIAPPPEVVKPLTTSFPARVLNVFAVPGHVFDEVRQSPARVANWLIPTLLWTVVTALFFFSQPEIQNKLRQNFTKTLDEQVHAGKFKETDAARAKQLFETVWTPAIIALVVLASFFRLLWWAFILWLFGLLFLGGRFNYVKGLEITGLATMIGVLGAIVALLLLVDVGPIFSGQTPNLTVTEATLNRRGNLIAGAAEVFSIWFLVVMAVGLSRLTGKPFLRTAWLVFIYWVMQMSFFYLLGAGQAGV